MHATMLWALLGFFSGIPAECAEIEVSYLLIKQIISAQKVVIAETSSPDIPVGQILLATFSDGGQCSLEVREKKDQYLTLGAANCERSEELRIKQNLEIALVPVASKLPEQSPPTPQVDSPSFSKADDIQSESHLVPREGLEFSVGYLNMRSQAQYHIDGTTNTIGNKIKYHGASLRMVYGLIDAVNVGAELPYQIKKDNEVEVRGATPSTSSSTDSSSFEDPEINVSFRPFKPTLERPFGLILTASYSPQWVSARSDRPGRGADKTGVSATFSRFYEKIETGITFGYDRTSKAEHEDAETGEKTQVISSEDIGVLIYGQFAVNEIFYMGVGAGFVSYPRSETREKTTGIISQKTGAYTSAQFGASAKLLLDSSSMISFEIISSTVDSVKYNMETAGGPIEGKIKDIRAAAFGVTYTHRM